jgi:1,5-anhydro-D-fructose reductase (1,5-anhydro-D-mannitol-forming)
MTIRWALLGPGRHANWFVAPQMKKAADTNLAAVVSRDRARGEAFAQKYDVPAVYTSVEDLLRDQNVDAIYDATPDGLHVRNTIAAATAGKHVLVEKPLAMSVHECLDAIAACRQHKVKLGVVFNQRHEAVHQEARRMVLAGEIGEVKLVNVQIPLRVLLPRPAPGSSWRADPAMRYGGIAVSIGDHAHDTLAYIVGQQIEEVSIFTDTTHDEPPDDQVCGMILKLSKGTIGYAAASFATPFGRRPFEIHGTKGTLIIENSFTYLSGGGTEATPSLTLVNEAGSNTRLIPASECFRLEVEQFNRAILGQGEPTTPAADGLRILAIGAALYSAMQNRRVARVTDFLPSLP